MKLYRMMITYSNKCVGFGEGASLPQRGFGGTSPQNFNGGTGGFTPLYTLPKMGGVLCTTPQLYITGGLGDLPQVERNCPEWGAIATT